MANYNLSEKEEKKAKRFMTLHKKCRPKAERPLQQYYPYTYEFTPTGIGIAVSIKCPYCGKTKDITDVDSW